MLVAQEGNMLVMYGRNMLVAHRGEHACDVHVRG